MSFNPEEQPILEFRDSNQEQDPTHIVKLRSAIGEPNLKLINVTTDQNDIEAVLSDEAGYPGASSPKKVTFSRGAGEAEVAFSLSEHVEEDQTVLAIGKQSSLTGAGVPMGDVVFDMKNMNEIVKIERGEDESIITVQPGVTVSELQEAIAKDQFFPPSPTHTEATIGGIISTNAKGARSDKYGATRDFVQGLTVVLDSGEVLEMNRGDYISHPPTEEYPGGYFVLQSEDGSERIVPIPSYKMPDVPKLSAGYFAKPEMDLIDLFVGSEGTLGVIVQAKLKAIKQPPTLMALVTCESDDKAFELVDAIRNQDPESKGYLDPRAISAIEIVGSAAVRMVKESQEAEKPEAEQVEIPEDENETLLLMQIEEDEDKVQGSKYGYLHSDDGEKSNTFKLWGLCSEIGVEDVDIALDSGVEIKMVKRREAAPETVNHIIKMLKIEKNDPGITKVGSDPSIKPELLNEMMTIYRKILGEKGIKRYVWFGHIWGVNIHINVVSESSDEVTIAREALQESGEEVIELGGTPMAEHGVGLSKRELLRAQYGEDGINQMRATRDAFGSRMARGNIVS